MFVLLLDRGLLDIICREHAVVRLLKT